MVGDVGLDGVGRNGFGGMTGFCIRDGFGGSGGLGDFGAIGSGIWFLVGEWVSMICSICVKQVCIAEINAVYCFGCETMAIDNAKREIFTSYNIGKPPFYTYKNE